MRRLTPRRLKIVNLLKQGKTLTEIGSQLGVSRQRVHQLVKNYLPIAGYTTTKKSSRLSLRGTLPKKGRYYVYFVELWYDVKAGEKHHIYVGQTQNLQQRWDHYLTSDQGAVAKLRNRNGTMRLAYFEEVESRSAALQLEKKYKQLSLEDKVRIIESFKGETAFKIFGREGLRNLSVTDFQ